MITYRDGTVDDAAVLDRVFDASFCDTFAHLYKEEDLQLFLGSFGVDDWRAELSDPDYAFRIAEVDGAPVGFVKLGPMKLPVETTAPGMDLKQLYILKEHHGAGIAQELMDWALAEARRRGADELYLTVYVGNHRARRFYDRYGFEAIGSYEFMVGNHPDEDTIMRKML